MGVLKLKDGQNWIPIKTIKGDSGVYVGDTEPDPSDYNVWIDPEGEDDTPQLINKADVITDSASGSIVSIPDGMASPVLGLDVDIEPIQDLHGYDNPWPAGGGKNKFNYENVPYDGTAVVNNGDGTLTINVAGGSTGVATSGRKTLAQLVPNLVVGETYYLNATTTGTEKYIYASTRWNFGSALVMTQTILDSVVYFYASGLNSSATLSNIIICKDSETDKTFAPYSNICPISGRSEVNVYVEETYDAQATPKAIIQLGQTVYGGTVDVTEGKLTIDKAIADLTTGMTGGTAGSGYVWYKQLQNALTVPNSQIADIISEAYIPIRFNAVASNVNYIALRDNGVIYVNNGSADVLPVGNVVYSLATPVEVTLTPQELDILFGDNNIWADSGSVSCSYRADTQKWLEKKFAEIQALILQH